jgi:hypothetical protein
LSQKQQPINPRSYGCTGEHVLLGCLADVRDCSQN